MVRLSVAVQAHPARSELAEALAGAIGDAEVVYDEDESGFPSPWRCYRVALERTPSWATHRLVVQDDATVCRNFAAAAELAVSAQPDGLVVFWHGGQPRENLLAIDRSLAAGCPWAPLNPQRWIPVVAVSWPADLIEPALEFVDEQGWPPQFRADDEIVGRIARHLGVDVCATVPSLVEHEDEVPSLVGKRTAHGRDKGRVAAHFIDAGDPLEISW